MSPEIERPVDFLMTYGAGVTPVETPPQVIGFGPIGPPGDGSDKYFVHNFTNLSDVTVNHNLGKYPAVTVVTSAGDEVVGNVEHTSTTTLTVHFGGSFSGKVICN